MRKKNIFSYLLAEIKNKHKNFEEKEETSTKYQIELENNQKDLKSLNDTCISLERKIEEKQKFIEECISASEKTLAILRKERNKRNYIESKLIQLKNLLTPVVENIVTNKNNIHENLSALDLLSYQVETITKFYQENKNLDLKQNSFKEKTPNNKIDSTLKSRNDNSQNLELTISKLGYEKTYLIKEIDKKNKEIETLKNTIQQNTDSYNEIFRKQETSYKKTTWNLQKEITNLKGKKDQERISYEQLLSDKNKKIVQKDKKIKEAGDELDELRNILNIKEIETQKMNIEIQEYNKEILALQKEIEKEKDIPERQAKLATEDVGIEIKSITNGLIPVLNNLENIMNEYVDLFNNDISNCLNENINNLQIYIDKLENKNA